MINPYEIKIPLNVIFKSFFKKNSKKELKEKLEKIYNRKILLTSSGSSALYIILKEIEKIKGKGSIVISNYSCKSIPRVVIRAGFSPIFIDIDKKMSMDVKLLEKAIKENKDIKAIISYHPNGFSFNKKIFEVSKNNNILLIEDCAVSFAKINKKIVGSFGDYAILSFRNGKIIHGGGGCIISNKEMNVKLKKKNFFIVFSSVLDILLRKIYNWEKPKAIFDRLFDKSGYCDMSNIEASLVLYQLKKIDEIREKRKENYKKILKEIPKDKLVELWDKDIDPIPGNISLLVNNKKDFIENMKKRKIKITGYYNHVNSDYFKGKIYGKKISELFSKKIVNIPVHENLKEEEIKIIIKGIKEYFKNGY